MRSHPRANKQGYVREHILIWEEVHNKSLPDGWVVHHLNGIKSDNRPSNLIALPSKKHRYWIPKLQKRIRELEVENKQLGKALKNNQTVFTV